MLIYLRHVAKRLDMIIHLFYLMNFFFFTRLIQKNNVTGCKTPMSHNGRNTRKYADSGIPALM